MSCASSKSNATTSENRNTSNAKASNTKTALEKRVDKPFHRLESKTWLHDRPGKDVFKLLIDTYRLSIDDDFTFERIRDRDTIYGGASDSLKGFQAFVSIAEMRQTLLPSWWSEKKRKECEDFGMASDSWQNLRRKVSKAAIVQKYGDEHMPMQMRMFREQVTGRGPMGQDSTAMRRVQMKMEGGELEGMKAATIDTSGFFK
jgi:splicing suppressor protein 51